MHRETLELSAIAPERQQCRIRTKRNPEGTIYEIVSPEELSPRQIRTVGNMISEMLTLWDTAETKAEEQRTKKLLNDIVKVMIPDASLATIKQLPDIDKKAMAMGFLVRFGQIAAGALDPQTLGLFLSGRQSQDSNGSTEETLEAG